MKAIDLISWALAMCGCAVCAFFVFMVVVVARAIWTNLYTPVKTRGQYEVKNSRET